MVVRLKMSESRDALRNWAVLTGPFADLGAAQAPSYQAPVDPPLF